MSSGNCPGTAGAADGFAAPVDGQGFVGAADLAQVVAEAVEDGEFGEAAGGAGLLAEMLGGFVQSGDGLLGAAEAVEGSGGVAQGPADLELITAFAGRGQGVLGGGQGGGVVVEAHVVGPGEVIEVDGLVAPAAQGAGRADGAPEDLRPQFPVRGAVGEPVHRLRGVDHLLVVVGGVGAVQGCEPLGPLGLQPDPGPVPVGDRGGRVRRGFGVGFGVEEPGCGGGPAQCPPVGPVPGGGDVRGLVLFGELFGGEQAQEVVEAVAVGGGVWLEQSGVGEVLGASGGLAQGQVSEQGCGGGAEVGAVREAGAAKDGACGRGQLLVGQGEGGPHPQGPGLEVVQACFVFGELGDEFGEGLAGAGGQALCGNAHG